MNDNEMNLTETQLRSWLPRRPSAGLKHRIFSSPQPARSATAWFVGSLAPVAACAFLSLVILNSGNGFPAGSRSRGAIIAMGLSNQSYTPFLSGGSQNRQNQVSSVFFDSTNGGVSPARVRLTPFAKPND